jgi:hypothetical protein
MLSCRANLRHDNLPGESEIARAALNKEPDFCVFNRH